MEEKLEGYEIGENKNEKKKKIFSIMPHNQWIEEKLRQCIAFVKKNERQDKAEEDKLQG